MYGLGVWGGPERHFFENWPFPLTVWVLFACSGQFSDTLHYTSNPIAGCTFGGATLPPYFWGRKLKRYVSEKVGTMGELYEGNSMKKCGRTSLLMSGKNFYPPK